MEQHAAASGDRKHSSSQGKKVRISKVRILLKFIRSMVKNWGFKEACPVVNRKPFCHLATCPWLKEILKAI